MRRFAAIAMLIVAGLAAPAKAETRVLLVPPSTLYPGDALPEGALLQKSFNGSAKVLSGYVENAAQATGKFARRTLVAGKPIALSALRNAEVVFEGKPAEARFESGGLVITTLLLPLASAAAGDEVKARNPDSGLTVTAVAEADGTLRVDAP